MKPKDIAAALKAEPLVTHTAAAAILQVHAPNFRRDYQARLTSIEVQSGETSSKSLFFRSEVEALAADRAAAAAA